MENTEVKATDVNQQSLGTGEVKDQAVETPDVKQSNVPYFRFKEVNDQLNDMKNTVSNLKANEEEREAKIKAEKGEYRELYEKEVELRKTAEAKTVKADEYFESRRDQIMSNWSDEDKEIYGDMPLENLERHNDSLNRTKAVKTNTAKSGVSQGKPFKGDIWDDSDQDAVKQKRKNWNDIVRQWFS